MGAAFTSVGRYLMDHPSCTLGHLTGMRDEWHRRLYHITPNTPPLSLPEAAVSEATARRLRILSARAGAYDVEGPIPPGLQALRQLRAAPTAFPDVPVVVLSAARGFPRRFRAHWTGLQAQLAASARRGRHVVVEGTGHDIPGRRPDVVADAILTMTAGLRPQAG